MNSNYYTYELVYPESMGSAVFYVGKGQGKRIDQHEKEARRGHECQKCDIIRFIWASGGEIVKTKLYTNLTEDEALRYEQEVIDSLDFATLANRAKLGQSKWMTPEWHEKRSCATKAKWVQIKKSTRWLERKKIKSIPRQPITFSIYLDANGRSTGRFFIGLHTQPGEQWATIEATDIDELQQKMKVFK